MRGFLASSIGVTCAAALTLPLALSFGARATSPHPSPTSEAVSGSTQSLPLGPLATDRSPSHTDQGVPRRGVRPFALVGVVWNDPDIELNGRVRVRTRGAGTGVWSGWQEVETHNHEHSADPDSAERTSGRVRGSTAPLWVGNSDGVEVQVSVEAAGDRTAGDAPQALLPAGLRLELVDPGKAPPAPADGPRADRAAVLPAPSERTVRSTALAQHGEPYIGPRPRIVTRKGWGADESLREPGYAYTGTVDAAFVHHTASGNNYQCSQAPSVIRSIYRYHVKSSGWRDIGYNFLVDKCGNIYEGRAGGVTAPVLGAHTLGFNSDTMGIAVLGTFNGTKPSSSAVNAIAKLTAWKLGLFGANPRGTTYLTSGGGNLYPKGRKVRLHVISGHRDGVSTDCPGARLYSKLGTARSASARLQGR